MSRYRLVAAAAALALAASPAFAQADAKAATGGKAPRPMVHHHAGGQKMGHGGASASNADHMADQLNSQVLTSIQQGGSSTPAGAGGGMQPSPSSAPNR